MAGQQIAYGRVGALCASIVATLAVVALTWGAADKAFAQAGGDMQGRAVFDHWCAPCHSPGPGNPGTQSLAIKYGDALPALLEERDDLTADAIRLFVREGVMSMAPFRKTEITDADLDALAAYLTE